MAINFAIWLQFWGACSQFWTTILFTNMWIAYDWQETRHSHVAKWLLTSFMLGNPCNVTRHTIRMRTKVKNWCPTTWRQRLECVMYHFMKRLQVVKILCGHGPLRSEMQFSHVKTKHLIQICIWRKKITIRSFNNLLVLYCSEAFVANVASLLDYKGTDMNQIWTLRAYNNGL